uniref:plasmid hypothetical protein 1 n=1 Tax=Moniliophthora perniciosa TaxID=153609 RepID=UPI000024236E|nr:plasmid hypothetical protein 1 [Moniliophthora perniciosa]AAQ74288.1 plasmid hypothetical protein 1 [Moniliophthora perniciosa]
MNFNLQLFNNTISFYLSYSSLIKVIIIFIFLLLNIYLFFESNKFNNRLLESAFISKNFRRYIGLIVSGAGFISAAITINEKRSALMEEASKIETIKKENENNLNLAKKELEEFRFKNQSDRLKYQSSLIRVEDYNKNIAAESQKVIDKRFRINKLNEEKEHLTDESQKGLIEAEIKQLERTIELSLIEITKSSEQIKKESQIIEKIDVDLSDEEVKSSIFSNIFELFDSMDVFSKIALSILAGNSVIVSCLISIIFIFYGNLIIEKYQIEQKYPNLFRIINLRRKFQKYYLITSISYIFIVTLTQIIFCIYILST